MGSWVFLQTSEFGEFGKAHGVSNTKSLARRGAGWDERPRFCQRNVSRSSCLSTRSRHGGPGTRRLRRPRQRERPRERIGAARPDQGAAGQPVRRLHVENERTPGRRAGCLHGSDGPGDKRLSVVPKDSSLQFVCDVDAHKAKNMEPPIHGRTRGNSERPRSTQRPDFSVFL